MLTASQPFDALMEITARPRTVFVQGKGSWLWDDTGKRYLDFIQGWAVNALGHAPPELAKALADQAARLITPSPAYFNETSLKLAKALVDRSCFDQVFFTNSGAEANEGAIKLARKYGALRKNGAHEIITFEGWFSRPYAGDDVCIRQEGVRTAVRAEGPGLCQGAPERHRLGRGADV